MTLNLFFAVDKVTSIFLSGLTVILIIGIILLFVFLARKNNAMKKLEDLADKISKTDFSAIKIESETELSILTYDQDFFSKTAVKEFITKPYEILSGQIIFSELLDFSKIRMEEAFQPQELKLKIKNDRLVIDKKEIMLKDITYIAGFYEPKKNSIFLEIKNFDNSLNFKFQITEYKVLYVLDQALKKYRQR
jgi:hypothetical protein